MTDDTNTTERIERIAHLVELTAREAGFPEVTPDAIGFRVFALAPVVDVRPGVVGIEHAKGELELVIRQRLVEVAGIAALNALTSMHGPCAPELPIAERVKRAQERAREIAGYLGA